MKDNISIIQKAKTKDECVYLMKFTIVEIFGDSYPSYQNGFDNIDDSFKKNTTLLTGNKNKCSWIARDITEVLRYNYFLYV